MSLRNIKDAALIATVNLPDAAASAVTPSLKIGTGPHLEILEGQIKIPALPHLVDAKTVTVTVQHSDDDGDDDAFAAIPELATLVVTGDGGDGADAVERDLRFPPSVKSYVRLKIDVLAAGGDNTDSEITLGLGF